MFLCQYITILQLFGGDICTPNGWGWNSQAVDKASFPHNFLAWHCWHFFRSPASLYPSSAVSMAEILVMFSGTVFSCVRQSDQGKHDTSVTYQWLKGELKMCIFPLDCQRLQSNHPYGRCIWFCESQDKWCQVSAELNRSVHKPFLANLWGQKNLLLSADWQNADPRCLLRYK